FILWSLDCRASPGVLCSTCIATCCTPLALFAMAMSLPTAAYRRLAQVVVVLAMASLLLGVAQIGMPRESLLNPYPQWVPAMSDLFANPNHQATLLAVATLACVRLAMVAGAWPLGRPHRVIHGVSSALVMLPVAVDELRGPLQVLTSEIAARFAPMRAMLARSLVDYPLAPGPCWRSQRRWRASRRGGPRAAQTHTTMQHARPRRTVCAT